MLWRAPIRAVYALQIILTHAPEAQPVHLHLLHVLQIWEHLAAWHVDAISAWTEDHDIQPQKVPHYADHVRFAFPYHKSATLQLGEDTCIQGFSVEDADVHVRVRRNDAPVTNGTQRRALREPELQTACCTYLAHVSQLSGSLGLIDWHSAIFLQKRCKLRAAPRLLPDQHDCNCNQHQTKQTQEHGWSLSMLLKNLVQQARHQEATRGCAAHHRTSNTSRSAKSLGDVSEGVAQHAAGDHGGCSYSFAHKTNVQDCSSSNVESYFMG